MNHLMKVALATVASSLRGWQGMMVNPAAVFPKKKLKLYDFEACPYCRLVREVLTELALDVDIYPCPKGGERFRGDVIKMGGKAQFPFLVDGNTGEKLYESADIIEYLYATYAKRPVPLRHKIRPAQTATSLLNTALGFGAGMNARPSKKPKKNADLVQFRGFPFFSPCARVVVRT